ncbi:hypothetical protein Tco_1430861 [Tanacetum coccineum]
MITNSKLKNSDEFLKILQDNAFNDMDGGDVIDHIAKVLETIEWIKMPNVEKSELRLHVFSKSLSGDAETWEYSPIPIPARRDIDNPDELCKTEEFTVIRHSIGNDKMKNSLLYVQVKLVLLKELLATCLTSITNSSIEKITDGRNHTAYLRVWDMAY